MSILSSLAANGTQWIGNVNQALGDQTAANKARSISSAIRDPNQVFTGNIGTILDSNKGSFSPVTPGVNAQPTKNVNGNVNPNDTYTGNGGAAVATGPTAADKANTIAQYDDAANTTNGAIGRLDATQAQGLQNILNSYQEQQNRLAQQKAQSERNYNTNKTTATNDFTQGRAAINNTVSNQNQALQNMLGLHGAGNSSAAYFAAPYAAARMGTQQLNSLQGNYAKNNQALDTNWQDFNTDYTNSLSDLDKQKFQQEQGLQSTVGNQRASLLDTLRQININRQMVNGTGFAQAAATQGSIQDQINNLLNQQVGLSAQYQNPVLQATDVSYQAPELSEYTLNPQAATDNSVQGVDTSTVSPYAYLFGRKDQNANPIF